SVRRHFGRPFLSDAAGRAHTYGQAALAALRLREALVAAGVARGERIGIVGGTDARAALAGLALLLAGAVPVHPPGSPRGEAADVLRGAGAQRLLALDPDPAALGPGATHALAPRELLACLEPRWDLRSLGRAAALLALPAAWSARALLGLDPHAVREP